MSDGRKEEAQVESSDLDRICRRQRRQGLGANECRGGSTERLRDI